MNIEYLTTEDIHNPVSTFRVTGTYNNLKMNEVVSLDRVFMSEFLAQEVDALTFLKEIEAITKNIETTKYREVLIGIALKQAEKAYNELEKYRLMMLLSNGKPTKQKKTVHTYNRHGKVETIA